MTSYIKNAAMITLLIFIPPLGLIFMYKYSTFDKRTNIILAVACIAFFIYANISAGNVENIFGSTKGFEQSLSLEDFRERYNTAAQRLAPNLDVRLDDSFAVDEKIFRHEFSPQLTLEGTIDDAGQITALKIFAAPENQDESFKTINVLGLLIAALNPELDAEDRGEVLRDLRMLKNVAAEDNYDWTTSRGHVKYSVHAVDGKVTFTAALNQ